MVEQAIKKLPEMQQQENEDCEWEVQLWAVWIWECLAEPERHWCSMPSMCGEKTTCPQWMAGEQLYNCENFTKTLRKAGFNLDRLFKQMRLSEQ